MNQKLWLLLKIVYIIINLRLSYKVHKYVVLLNRNDNNFDLCR